ncbi:recombinase family protein [Sphingosinicellaceae bacterium]|nr:recombinase family protein [Sphingosinicellaceae bacterium]
MLMAIYTRTSVTDRVAAASAVNELVALAGALGATGVLSYHDDASARVPVEDRPGLCRLVADIRGYKVSAVLINSLDRLDRDPKVLARLIDSIGRTRIPFYMPGPKRFQIVDLQDWTHDGCEYALIEHDMTGRLQLGSWPE